MEEGCCEEAGKCDCGIKQEVLQGQEEEECNLQVPTKKRGRPSGTSLCGLKVPDSFTPSKEKRRPPPTDVSTTDSSSPAVAASVSKKESSKVTSSPSIAVGGTKQRPKIFLLDQPPTSTLSSTKLPKTREVLRVFFDSLLKSSDLSSNPNPSTLATKKSVVEAATATVDPLKEVWRHHFGIRLIDGQDIEGGEVNRSNIMILRDWKIQESIGKLFYEWKALEQLSRRPDRQKDFLKKEVAFREGFKNKKVY